MKLKSQVPRAPPCVAHSVELSRGERVEPPACCTWCSLCTTDDGHGVGRYVFIFVLSRSTVPSVVFAVDVDRRTQPDGVPVQEMRAIHKSLCTVNEMVRSTYARMDKLRAHPIYEPIFLRITGKANHKGSVQQAVDDWKMMITSCEIELANLELLVMMPPKDRGQTVAAIFSSMTTDKAVAAPVPSLSSSASPPLPPPPTAPAKGRPLNLSPPVHLVPFDDSPREDDDEALDDRAVAEAFIAAANAVPSLSSSASQPLPPPPPPPPTAPVAPISSTTPAG